MKIKEIKEEEIIFDNGYKLKYFHDQDCCELVYADFEILKKYNVSTKTGKKIDIYEIDFCEELNQLVKGIKNCGFNLLSKIGEKFFVPCYNDQNGNYSDELELILNKNRNVEKMDITRYKKDIIY